MEYPTEVSIGAAFPVVLEQAAFAFADPSPPASLESPEEALIVRIGFKGGAGGKVILATSSAFALELAGNVLGADLDPEQSQDQAKDALRELTNVVCGNMLTTLIGEAAVFDLGAPQVEALSAGDWTALAANAMVHGFIVDGAHPLLLSVEFSD